jgi:hypothetical protein
VREGARLLLGETAVSVDNKAIAVAEAYAILGAETLVPSTDC